MVEDQEVDNPRKDLLNCITLEVSRIHVKQE